MKLITLKTKNLKFCRTVGGVVKVLYIFSSFNYFIACSGIDMSSKCLDIPQFTLRSN